MHHHWTSLNWNSFMKRIANQTLDKLANFTLRYSKPVSDKAASMIPRFTVDIKSLRVITMLFPSRQRDATACSSVLAITELTASRSPLGPHQIGGRFALRMNVQKRGESASN